MGKAEAFFAEKEDLDGLIPERYLEDIRGKRLILSLYSGVPWDDSDEDDVLRGMALFVKDPISQEGYEFRYIYLATETRYQGVSKLLIDEAERLVKKKNPVSFVSFFPEETKNNSLLALYDRYGFKATGNIKKIVYSFGDMLDSEFGDTVTESLNKTSHILKKDNLSRTQILELTKLMESRGRHFDIQEVDGTFSGFFTSKDRVLGFMDLTETDPGVLTLRQLYVESAEEAKTAIPLLLSHMLNTVEEEMEEEPLFVYQGKESLVDTFKKLFGKPLAEQSLIEYRR